MRKIPLSLILLTATAIVAQDDPFITGEALQAALTAKCAEGCVIFSRQDAAAFEAQLEAILSARMRDAFNAGVQN